MIIVSVKPCLSQPLAVILPLSSVSEAQAPMAGEIRLTKPAWPVPHLAIPGAIQLGTPGADPAPAWTHASERIAGTHYQA
jgi:hypothetical protein